jgi:hypothetical protein
MDIRDAINPDFVDDGSTAKVLDDLARAKGLDPEATRSEARREIDTWEAKPGARNLHSRLG